MSEQTHSDAPAFGLRHRLALALEVAELKPEDMAAELGRSVTTIRNYLKGRTVPSRGVLTAWALRCRVSRDWIEYGIPSQNGGPTGPRGLHSGSPGCSSQTPALALTG